jgi:phage baseplate assembly protein V
MSILEDRLAAGDIDRRVSRLMQFGTVKEIDLERSRLRVQLSGDATSKWVPWIAGRAGTTRFFSAPSVGEQVVLLSEAGGDGNAVALLGVYSSEYGAPAAAAGVTRLEFPEGAAVEISGGAITIDAPGGISIQGNVIVQGDVVADGISLKDHLHGGILRGGSKTDPPS